MKKQLPPPTPPYTGGETNARKHRDATAPRLLPLPKGRAMDAQMHRDAILPLCKGESEGVVFSMLNFLPVHLSRSYDQERRQFCKKFLIF